jgi:lysophospholipase L1-like esterase
MEGAVAARGWVPRLVVGLSIAILLSGCSASATPAPQVTPIPTPVPTVATASPSATPSATPSPSAASLAPSPTSCAGPSASAPWGLVVLGDSIMGYVAIDYATRVGADAHVAVETYNAFQNGASSGDILSSLKGDGALRAAIACARLIAVEVPAGEFNSCGDTLVGGTQAQIDACLDRVVAQYEADASAIFTEIVSLSSPSKAAIRAFDLYQINYELVSKAGTYQFIKPYWQRVNAAVIAAAGRYKIPVARVFDAFMGPKGNTDPITAGLVQPPDQTHPTEAGVKRIVQLLAALGYEPAT